MSSLYKITATERVNHLWFHLRTGLQHLRPGDHLWPRDKHDLDSLELGPAELKMAELLKPSANLIDPVKRERNKQRMLRAFADQRHDDAR